MTSEEWIALIKDEKDRKYAREAVNAALESEREGEVVLGTIVMMGTITIPCPAELDHKKGRLIFVPEGEK